MSKLSKRLSKSRLASRKELEQFEATEEALKKKNEELKETIKIAEEELNALHEIQANEVMLQTRNEGAD